jgi:hypothetical protein
MNDTEEHEISDDNAQLFQDMPVSSIKFLLSLLSPTDICTQSPSYDEVHDRVEWVPDNEAKECFYCQTQFTAIKRRHHCRY